MTAVQAVSPIVGYVLRSYVSPSSGTTLVVTTQHAQLVRLSPDWTRLDVLDFTPPVTARGPLRFGPIEPVSATEVIVPFTTGNQLVLALVDHADWRLSRTRVFADRGAVFPSACSSDGYIYVGSEGWLDKYDARKLERVASTRTEGDWLSALACSDDVVYGVSSSAAVGWAFDPASLMKRFEFRWRGARGGHDLVVDDEHVVGTDRVHDVLFRCTRDGGRCDEAALDGTPSSLLLEGGDIFVALEDASAVAVVDKTDMTVEGLLRLPSRPRTLAIVERHED